MDKYVDEALEELILVKHAVRLRKRLRLLEGVAGSWAWWGLRWATNATRGGLGLAG